jgi:hypothetical protein
MRPDPISIPLTQIDAGTLTAANGFLLENGKNLVGKGLVSKGAGPSASRFLNRGYVEGPPSASSDWLNFDTFLAGSTLMVTPWNGFVPDAGDTCTLVTWGGSLSGSAPVLADPWFGNHGIQFTPRWNANSLVLTAVPEPCTLALLGMVGLCALFVAGVRKRT